MEEKTLNHEKEDMVLLCLENNETFSPDTLEWVIRFLTKELLSSDEITDVSNSFQIEDNVFMLLKVSKKREDVF